MRHPQQLVFSVFLAIASVAFFLSASTASLAKTTVTLDQPVHFTTAEGSDVVLDAGDYELGAADAWLRVTPSEGQAVDALLLDVQVAKHEEALKAPLGISVQGESPDTHHLALLLPDGKRLEAIGSYSGIRSRGLSLLTIRRLQRLAAARKSTPSSEFVSPLFGGGGGNRSYNLDCGSGAVMIGVMGKVGMWLDSLGAICQRVNSNGQLGAEFTTRTTGGVGGAVEIKKCPSGRVSVGASAETGSFVEALVLNCWRWDAANKTFLNHASGDAGFIWLAPEDYYINRFNPDHDFFKCPASKVLKALRGKSGIYIDSIRFACDSWNK